jgi:hypothetical protein
MKKREGGGGGNIIAKTKTTIYITIKINQGCKRKGEKNVKKLPLQKSTKPKFSLQIFED